MLSDRNIVCFAKDWSEDPTSNNHIMRLLAENNRVLWINSVVTRTPTFTDGKDLKKMAVKAVQFARGFSNGAEKVADGLWVFTPIVIPLPHNAVAQKVNRFILRRLIRAQMRRIGMSDEFQLWTFLPTTAQYVDDFGQSLLVYFITDEFSQFSYLDKVRIKQMDLELCKKSDVVFVTANSLLESKAPYNENTYLASHGVDRGHFAVAVDDSTQVHPEIRDLPGPVLGFFGLIHDWVDLDLIEDLAKRRPNWSIVLIGKATVNVARFDAIDNVHLLGRRSYDDLPAYCKGFDVALIPFVVNELTIHVNPIKLREYLSAGCPVVSTPLPEVDQYRQWCHIAASPDAFLADCDAAIAADSAARRARRSEAMKSESWRAKVAQLGEHVKTVETGMGS